MLQMLDLLPVLDVLAKILFCTDITDKISATKETKSCLSASRVCVHISVGTRVSRNSEQRKSISDRPEWRQPYAAARPVLKCKLS